MQTITTTGRSLYLIRLGLYGSKYFLTAYNTDYKTNDWKQKNHILQCLPISEGVYCLIKKLMEQGKFKAVIDRKYPFEQIIEAYKYVETGQKTGNVVITVEHNNKT